MTLAGGAASRSAVLASRRCGLPPAFDERARVLILGSFPGIASLSKQQYYAHPRNQFWPIIGRLLACDLASLPYQRRLDAAVAAGLAIWDVIDSCVRPGSLDSSIEQAQGNELYGLINQLPTLRAVAFNGRKAAHIGRKLIPGQREIVELPSTSPANAGLSLDEKYAQWRVLQPYLN